MKLIIFEKIVLANQISAGWNFNMCIFSLLWEIECISLSAWTRRSRKRREMEEERAVASHFGSLAFFFFFLIEKKYLGYTDDTYELH